MALNKINRSEVIVCKICCVSIRNAVNCVKCADCSEAYHHRCILLVRGLVIDGDGEIHCCRGLEMKVCDCEKKDKEIVILKQRLMDINSSIFEKTIFDSELVDVDEESDNNCEFVGVDEDIVLAEKMACLEKQLVKMELSLTSKLGKVESMLGGAHFVDVNSNVKSLDNISKQIDRDAIWEHPAE